MNNINSNIGNEFKIIEYFKSEWLVNDYLWNEFFILTSQKIKLLIVIKIIYLIEL